MIKTQIQLKTGLNSELLLLLGVFQVTGSETRLSLEGMVKKFDIKNQALSLRKTENHCPGALLFQLKDVARELLSFGKITGAFEKLMKYSYSLHSHTHTKGYMHTPITALCTISGS